MHNRIHIKNATIVNEGRRFVGSVVLDDDRIEEVLEGRDALPTLPADEVIDAEGCFVLPGVIDDHVHFRDPGLTQKADFDSESRAAAAGGVTTVLDMPNTLPPAVTLERIEEKRAIAAQRCHVNYGFFLGASKENAATLSKINPRIVAGIKLYMGSSTGSLQVEEDDALLTIFEQSRLPIMVHCEDTPTIMANLRACKAQHGDDPDVCFHPIIRSEEACYKSTSQAIRLAKRTGARLHVAHLTTARELELFEPNDGQITAEACLPHLVFTDADYKRLGTRIKCNPAIKTEADRAALRAALTDGRICCVGTDHAPHTITDKMGGAAKAASGMPFVQFSLVAMLELVDEGVLTIERLVELMCHQPAKLFAIENRGFLRPGHMADIVIVRPDSPWTVTPNRILSKCNWSPVEGKTYRWRVESTFVNGFLIYNNGQITNDNFRGRSITYLH
ncbi:dihydroorotase [Alloprevotella sp. OH1205_COT-284]|uniref:dihydroorotase n=1 Tax=Alloprevotella sp. OH1205_COT-284 TaxID=2491043 RepID=UPI000F5D80FE|nr:dihydroorotase [Alloprevotella sp. OH1205_COT-284]RRD80064.1 dihydroorotase [Alloprevotella sp. OH1205_COT-284]